MACKLKVHGVDELIRGAVCSVHAHFIVPKDGHDREECLGARRVSWGRGTRRLDGQSRLRPREPRGGKDSQKHHADLIKIQMFCRFFRARVWDCRK